jgi:hypothetical protein
MKDNPKEKFNEIVKFINYECKSRDIKFKYTESWNADVIVLKFSGKDNKHLQYAISKFDLEYKSLEAITSEIGHCILSGFDEPYLQRLL